MIEDLKEIEQHLRNVALIDEDEPQAKVYKETANSLKQTITLYKPGKGNRGMRSTLNRLSSLIKKLQKTSDDSLLTAYNYTARMLKDVITDYGEPV